MAFLAACGGGGSSPTTPVAEPPPTVPTACAASDAFPVDADYLAAPVAATASSSDGSTTPELVYGHGPTIPHWISAGKAPQWLMLDLGSPRVLTELRLCVIQAKSGVTSHQISAGLAPDALAVLMSVTGATENGQMLSIPVPASARSLVRYLKIETLASPATVAWGRIEAWGSATNRPAYFGYYADAFSWLTRITPEVASHVNVSWVSSDLAGLADLLANLQQAHALGIKTALAVPVDVFFTTDLDLAPDHEQRWNDFADQIRPHIDDVAFLYPIDEPYSQAKTLGIPAATMLARLQAVGTLMKATFPTVPLAFTFSAIDFDTQDSAFADLVNPLPSQYDFFGFDCYGSWEACGEASFRAVHAIPWYVDRLKEQLGTDQRLFLFSDAFVVEAMPGDPALDAEQARLRTWRAEQYRQLALSDASIIGLFAFLYQDDYVEGAQRFLGVRHWPELQARYISIGRFITGK